MFEQEKMKDLYIFGTGSGAEKLLKQLNLEKVNIKGFLDRDEKKTGSVFHGKRILHPSQTVHDDFDWVLIATEHTPVLDFLVELGYPEDKCALMYRRCQYVQKKNELHIRRINALLKEPRLRITERYTEIMRKPFEEEIEDIFPEYSDYNRIKTLQLIRNEICRRNISGQVAEMGVFQGDFAAVINYLFADRKCYLFDTFEGFDQEELEFDLDRGYSKKVFLEFETFNKTSEEIVLEKMAYPERIEIRKGLFPATAEGLEEEFAFVSLDADLYLPILNGLRFFYPRLARGGYIFVHDYNYWGFPGVRQAVDDFEKEYGMVPKVPLCDGSGTLIMTK